MSTLEVKGATIRYQDRGEGPVLLLVHGGLGAGSEWDLIAKKLAESFRVITPDSLGHGRSPNPAGELSYPLLADDLAAIAKTLELDRPTVVGWSDGGQVALELAVRHPGLAGALVLDGAYLEFECSGLRETHRELLEEIEANPDDGELQELIALPSSCEPCFRTASSPSCPALATSVPSWRSGLRSSRP
jgi:pimeloyl-ACP methyl ester carboxylesterase